MEQVPACAKTSAVDKVSVVIPCYNEGRFLTDAVESVLDQQATDDCPLPEIEVIVVDDGSTDTETRSLLLGLSHRAPEVRVLTNARAKGVSGARNHGIAHATGNWIAFLDGDDRWFPHALGLRWRLVVENPRAEWIAADFEMVHPDGSTTASGNRSASSWRGRLYKKAFDCRMPVCLARPFDDFIHSSLVWVGTVLVTRSLLQRVGGFNESLRRAEDYELWMRLACEADLFFVPELVALYRQRAGTLTAADEAPCNNEIDVFSSLMGQPRFERHQGALRARLAEFYLSNCYYYRKKQERYRAVVAACGAIRWKPRATVTWKQLLAASVGL